jgi:hypothetical protein
VEEADKAVGELTTTLGGNIFLIVVYEVNRDLSKTISKSMLKVHIGGFC